MVAQLDVGSTANSYSIIARLASGGMAELFLARNASGTGIERYVVLKRVLRAQNAEEVQMFLDETKLAAQLQHPNIAQLYDTGKLGDSFFYTMEYVHGETVRDVIVKARLQGKDIPIELVLTIASGAAAGLHHAHERIGLDGHPLGIVHRDVSPSNLMISYEGNVKVVDFGIAKARSSSIETRSGTVRGKISYLSPEQCRAKDLDRRSDLFSLGIVMWELLVRDRLYNRGSDFDNMEAIIRDDSPPPSSKRADVPPEVDALVCKLLARKPGERFQTGAELLEEIDRVAKRNHLQLSVAALGRFMRELFGTRPEPWLEHRGREKVADAATVTAQPIDGVQPWTIHVSKELSNVIDLAKLTGATMLVSSPKRRRRRRAWLALPIAAAISAGVAAGVVIHDRTTVAAESPPPPSPSPPPPPSPSPSPSPPPSPSPSPSPPPSPSPSPPPSPPPPASPSPSPSPSPKPAAPHPVPHPLDVAACAASPHVVTQNAIACTLAACRVNDVARARKWSLEVPAGKLAAITQQCVSLGTVIDAKPKPPPSHDACKTDPLACRR